MDNDYEERDEQEQGWIQQSNPCEQFTRGMMLDDDYMADNLFFDHAKNPYPRMDVEAHIKAMNEGDLAARNALFDELCERGGQDSVFKKGQIEIGAKLWFRTYTVFDYGEVVDIGAWWIKLKSAVWVAHTGNFGNFANTGECQDEKVIWNHCYLSTRALVDWGKFNGKLRTPKDNPYTPLLYDIDEKGKTTTKPMVEEDGQPFRIGEPIWIRTASVYNYGFVSEINVADVTLTDGAWIANTGQFDAFTKDGTVGEDHKLKDHITVCLRAVVDWGPFKHPNLKNKKQTSTLVA